MLRINLNYFYNYARIRDKFLCKKYFEKLLLCQIGLLITVPIICNTYLIKNI